ncbi:DUF3883 domain-containing protein [Nostoc sp. ATCC 53789]|uniref:DUF3883 domain-containing protein n=1 Tax=Nostoc sp. ATCC 53789 TaxID=76335 RepID=UPI000E0830FC|nr:DUF3883 domain-containing protein [Nostoc sp. ATCC 53789]RCJ23764.1 hypothetical protein A6V25_04935 [Nostoc sp. ATCC 53789]
MRYWVQYHNFEKIQSFPDGFGISTNKHEVLDTIGNTIFLIVGVSEPRKYLLWERFICTDVEDGYPPPWQYVAYGDGWILENRNKQKGVLLNSKPDFFDYLRYCQNFRVGFHEVTEHPFCKVLIELSEQHRQKNQSHQCEILSQKVFVDSTIETDTVFGNSYSNKVVELAAIKVITNYYEGQGCKVVSVESKNLGYDLICKANNGIELHVEVKGISGKGKQFIISANEVTEAKKYPSIYRLAFVNMATSDKPVFIIYTGEEFLQRFDLRILNYVASLK